MHNFKITFLLFFFLISKNIISQNISINEIVSSNSSINSDEDGDFEDWIEIYNYGTTSVNLSGFGLSDQTDNPFKWRFPSIILEPKEFILIWASDKNRTSNKDRLHTNFKLKSGGESIILTNSNGAKIDESPAVAIATDNSYGRKPDGTGSWSFFTEPTPKDSNTGATTADPEKVVINEFVSSNTTGLQDSDDDFEDWIEIYNYGTTAINLNGFGLSDDRDLPYKWVLPSITINTNEYILIWASSKDRKNGKNDLHTNFNIAAEGETLFLTNSNGLLISGSPSVNLETDTSYGRKPDGTGSWLFFNSPSPLASNSNSGSTTTLESPNFSHDSGLYSSSFNLSLSSNVQNATIVYTLDGSEPDINNLSGASFSFKNDYPTNPGDNFGELLNETYKSFSYSSPINVVDTSLENNNLVNKNTNQFEHFVPPNKVRKAFIVKAKTFLDGKGSQTKAKTYFVWSGGNPYDLPVISIQIPEKKLFDYNDGIYTSGIDFDTWRENNPNNNQSWRPEISNYARSGREWEYESDIELFEPKNLNSIENLRAGFRIHGNNSRIAIVKNLRLYARSEYDDNNKFDHNFFKQNIPNAISATNNNFKRILLRGDGAGGSVSYDVAFSRAMQPIYNGVTRIQPAIHFINGEYWGITAFRDRLDEFHYEYNFGVSRENFVQITCNGSKCDFDEGIDGDYETFIAMRDFILENNMSNSQNYAQAESLLDMESFIDHAIMVIFAANNSYERKFWRARNKENNDFADGKWRVSTQDYEASLANFDWLEYLSNTDRSANNRLLADLLKNENFKNRFLNRFADIINTVYDTQHFTKIINEVFEEVNPYLSEDQNRSDREDYYTTTEKNNLLEWAEKRPEEQRNIILNQFNISNTINLQTNVSYFNAGYVKVNTIDVRESTPGVSSNPYPWSGKYFQGIPITLEAKEYPGFTFSNWSGSSNSSNKEITITPTGNIQLTANYTRDEDFEHTIFFWLFDDKIDNDTPLENINATYSRNNTNGVLNYQSSLSGYPFTSSNVNWRKASLERENNPTPLNYVAFANDDTPYNASFVKGLQIKQPFRNESLENTLELNISTVNFKDIKLALAIESDGAAQTLIVDYWDGNTWSTNNISSSLNITNDYSKAEVDFSNVSSANNNSNFKIRLRFNGSNMFEDQGKSVSLNNISIAGIESNTLSNEEFDIDTNSLKIYPNPAKNQLKVVSLRNSLEKITIYNMLGQIVYSKGAADNKLDIDLSSLKKGVYLLRVLSDGKIISRRIVKN